MKKIYYLLFSLLVIGGSALAGPKISEENIIYGYGDSFIFVEGGVEFAVYPDGQFDFFYNSKRNGYNVNVVTPHMNISYNAGYNYDPFVQYDDFGAVIQIEHVPVFYDYYGRIIQAGNVYISYNNFGRIARIGGLHLHYNPYNQLTHYSGYINPHNVRYVAKPWHHYYRQPLSQFAVVYRQPYRTYYTPNRVTYNYHVNYYNTHYNNGYKKSYYRPGQQVTSYHRGSRTAQERDLRPRSFNSDYSVATRMDDRNDVRSNSTVEKTRTRATVNTQQNNTRSGEVSTARGRENRVSPLGTQNVRDTRSVQQRQPAVQQKQVRERQAQARNRSREISRNTGINSSTRETRASTPAARRTNRNSTVQAPVRETGTSTSTARRTNRTSTIQAPRVSKPQAASSGTSRSSRGRGQ